MLRGCGDVRMVSLLINFLDTLEDDDDVQHVYSNLEINSNFVKKI